MKILFLCAQPPRPDGTSDSVVAYNRIRLLAERGHDISLACFLSEGQQGVPQELQGIVSEMELLPFPHLRPVPAMLRRWVLGGGANPYRPFFSKDMSKLVGRLVALTKCDVLMAESAAMGQYLYRNPYLPAVRRVLSCQRARPGECGGILASTELKSVRSGVRARIGRRRTELYEMQLYRFADHVITLTLHERVYLLGRLPDLNVSAIPYGQDLSRLPTVDAGRSERRLLFTGLFSEPTDARAADWLLQNVWPDLKKRVLDATLCIAGQGISKSLRALAMRREGVEVQDGPVVLAEQLSAATVFVCPMLQADGFQPRVLRAMGAGLAVVSTSFGVEGIPVQTGTHVFLADTSHTFAEALHLLLEDAALRRRLGTQSRHLIEKQFSWRHGVDRLEDVLQSLMT
jgi:glycosyltransferase involved in cell wall biosynthesis